MAKTLRSSVAPNLPIAPVDYAQRYQDQLLNVLRLYFSQLDNFTQVLMENNGGRFLNFPQGSFYDTTNQYDGSTIIPYAVRLGQTSTSSGVSITSRTFSGTGSIGPASTTMTITAVASGRLYPSMLLGGTNVTAGTYVYLQLSSTATALAGPYTFVSGGAPTATTVVLNSVTGLEARQFISGTGLPANTRIVSVDPLTNTVTVSAAFTLQAAGTYTVRPWGYEGTYSVNPSQSAASATITGNLPSLITFEYSGLYNIQYSLQFTNTDLNKVHEVDVWYRLNDVDIPDSNSQFSVAGAHAGHNGQLIAQINLFVEVQGGDVVEIIWHTNDSTIYMETIPAATNPIRPQTPSAIVTVQFVSELPQ